MKKVRQLPLRLTTEPDPNFCALSNHRQMKRRPTHTVTVKGNLINTFRVCRECAFQWERVSSATVRKIQEAA